MHLYFQVCIDVPTVYALHESNKENKNVTYSSDDSWSYSLSPRHGRTHMLNDPAAPLDDIQSALLFLFKKKSKYLKFRSL